MSEKYTPQDQTDWGYTVNAKELFGDEYHGRPQIGRDTEITGGVYMGTYGGEAIVVDPQENAEVYNPVVDKVLERSKDLEVTGRFKKKTSLSEVKKDLVLGAVFDTVKETLPYSQEGVNNTLQDIARHNGKEFFADGTKVDLAEFIVDGNGVCRHQALLCGMLLEKMKSLGHISGNASVERNQQWSPRGELGGHAWIRYTNSGGQVYILDVAQDFIGTLEESQQRTEGWNYLRPEEKRQEVARKVMDMTGIVEVENAA